MRRRTEAVVRTGTIERPSGCGSRATGTRREVTDTRRPSIVVGTSRGGVMAGIEFDDDTARQIVTAYSTPDIVGQRASVLSMLMLRPGEHVLDIGAGPGFLAAEMAAEIG